MKKILSFLVLLASVVSLTSCGDDDATYRAVEPLDITYAQVLFEAGGGDGSIEVNTASSITATTDASWLTLTVDGNKVIVSADLNEDLEGRSARITLTAADGATGNVTATQNGLLFSFTGESVYVVDQSNAAPVEIVNKSNANGEEIVDVDWIHYTVDENGKYTFTFDDNDGDYRKGSFSVTVGDQKKNIYFGQWGTGSLRLTPGEYIATWQEYNNNDQLVKNSTTVNVASGTAANTFVIQGLCDDATENGSITLNYNASRNEYYITSGFVVGKLNNYTLRCAMDYQNASGTKYVATGISTSATYQYRMAFSYSVDDEANLVLKYVKNSNLNASYSTPGFRIYAYSSTTSMATNYRINAVHTYYGLSLSRIEEESE